MLPNLTKIVADLWADYDWMKNRMRAHLDNFQGIVGHTHRVIRTLQQQTRSASSFSNLTTPQPPIDFDARQPVVDLINKVLDGELELPVISREVIEGETAVVVNDIVLVL